MPARVGGLKAAVFDRDFTILDTLRVSQKVIFEVFRRAGLKPPSPLLVKAAWAAADSDREFWRILLHGSGAGRGIEWFELQYRRLYPRYLHLARPYPDAGSMLQELHSRGTRLALVSALPNLHGTRRALQSRGLIKYFDVIVTAEVLSKRLDIYRADHYRRKLGVVSEALGRLGVSPRDALMVGDTHVDVRVGRRLGMKTAALIRSGAARAILEAGPDFYLRDLDGIVSLMASP